ncbi:MAG TPA: hypothetical protein VMT34_09400, partial [Aggregatilineales bacterium]|nr:hypothetical protein [Aggregatilineales bacterium]
VNRGLAVQGTLPSEQAIRGMAAATDRYVPVSTASALPRTYQIIHASGDEKTASQVKIVLDGLRYAAVSSDAAYTILILSYRTPLPMIRDCLKTAQHVIGLLATDINLPGDLPELTRLQLIDYRSGGSQQLFSAFQFLGDDTEASRAALSQNLMPVNLAQNRKNRDLSSVFSSLLILACINLLYSVYFVARLAFFGLPLLPVPDALKPEAIGIVSLLVVNLVFIWFGMGALRGLARIPTGLLILIAAISPVFIALIDLSAHLPPQATLAVPSGKPVTIHLGIGQALAFIALYGLFYLLLARTLGGQPHLLNRPGTHAIGLESVKPDWRLVGSGLLLVIFLLFASLTSSGQ